MAKQRWEESERGEEKKREGKRKRKKIQVLEKAGKSRFTVFLSNGLWLHSTTLHSTTLITPHHNYNCNCNCNYTTLNYHSTTLHYTTTTTTTALHPNASSSCREVTAATFATPSKNTTPTTFQSFGGFALPYVIHSNQPLL